MYIAISAKIKDLIAQFQAKASTISETSWPVIALMAGLLLAIIILYFTRSSGGWRLKAHKRLALRKIRRRRSRGTDQVVGFVFGMFGVIFNFFRFTLYVVGNVFLFSAIYFVVVTYPDPFKNIGLAFYGPTIPPQFQGFNGALILFSIIAAGLLLGFAIFIVSVKIFAELLASQDAPRPRATAFIVAYLLYGASLTITIGLFSKFAAIVCILVTFILAPIILGLIGLIVDETK